MAQSLERQIAELGGLTVPELRRKYTELFGDVTGCGNKPWLIKRIAWRLQALAEGGLSERARQRAAELANEADLRLNPPKILRLQPAMSMGASNSKPETPICSDSRLPLPGTVLTRSYKGQTLQVRVLGQGFEFGGAVYRSLSAVAKAITGSHCNGFHFFGLNKQSTTNPYTNSKRGDA